MWEGAISGNIYVLLPYNSILQNYSRWERATNQHQNILYGISLICGQGMMVDIIMKLGGNVTLRLVGTKMEIGRALASI